MDAEYVKGYFKSPGTVATWWNPELGDKAHIFQREAELIRGYISGLTGKALDVACGKGRISELILQNENLDLDSIDISTEMLNIAKKRNPGLKLHRGDAEQLPFEQESYELVTCLDALVHFPNPDTAISEAYRVLKKRGTYIVNTSNPHDLNALPRAISKGIRKTFGREEKFTKGKKIFQYLPERTVRRSLEETGFSIEEVRRIGVLPPIEFDLGGEKSFYLLTPNMSRGLSPLDEFLENIPIINKFGILSFFRVTK